MKYVITGGAGHISKPLAEQLLSAGHDVTVVGRNPENLKSLTEQGAKAAIGSVEDLAFLTGTFKGADAVYTMVPPVFQVDDWKAYIGQIGKNYAEAIATAGVKYVVNLSSMGAHMEEGAGPVSGLYKVEQHLNGLKNVNVKHIRPGYFFYNFYGNIGMIKGMNLFGGNAASPTDKMVLSHTGDIAKVIAEELLNLEFTGHSVRYIASDERTGADVAKTLGMAINKPELAYVEFSDEDTLIGLKSAGLPEEIAKNYTELGHAMRTGQLMEDYSKNRPQQFGNTKLEDFAKEFAAVYNAS